MIVHRHAMGFRITPPLLRRLDLRIWHGLRHVAERVVDATVRLDDINGSHGGVDKRCSIVARLKDRRTVVARAVHQDLYAAIDWAAARIRVAAERSVSRRGARDRKGPQRHGSLWQERSEHNARSRFDGGWDPAV